MDLCVGTVLIRAGDRQIYPLGSEDKLGNGCLDSHILELDTRWNSCELHAPAAIQKRKTVASAGNRTPNLPLTLCSE
jgi:hypothetical protein